MASPTCPSNEEPTRDEIQAFWNLCKRAAMRHGASPDEAEVVAQETVLKLLDKWNSDELQDVRAQGQGALCNYVATMAKNTHVDEIRRHERRTQRERKAAGCVSEPLLDRPNVTRPQPRDSSVVEQFMGRAAIADLIKLLRSDRQRHCLWRVFVDGWTAIEIAEELELDPQTVRRHIADGRSKVREHLEAQAELAAEALEGTNDQDELDEDS